jgi:LacI family transcriptional regulator
MPRRPRHPAAAIPRVALLVETSLASGRDILRGIARYVREHGPWSLYHEAHSLEAGLPRWLAGWDGDGIIVRVQSPRIAAGVEATGIPAVDVLGVVEDAQLPLVHVNDRAVAAMAAEHLRERGFRHFAYFGICGENWSTRRREAFSRAVGAQQGGLAVCELPRRSMESSDWERQENALADWVRALPKPTGIMVCSDQVGQHLLEACRRAAVAVPDDVAVVGVDNDEPLCEVCHPPLSSVNAGHLAVGYEAAALLDRMLRGGPARRAPQLVPPHGVVTRQSTDVLATNDRQVAAALRLIREQACAGLSAADVVAAIPVSRSVLQRRFRKELGRSIQEETINVRVKRARELLAETDLALAEVAERCGFKHQEYLGAVFKARTGHTPAQYRRLAARR